VGKNAVRLIGLVCGLIDTADRILSGATCHDYGWILPETPCFCFRSLFELNYSPDQNKRKLKNGCDRKLRGILFTSPRDFFERNVGWRIPDTPHFFRPPRCPAGRAPSFEESFPSLRAMAVVLAAVCEQDFVLD
jgi:hypothetical protein